VGSAIVTCERTPLLRTAEIRGGYPQLLRSSEYESSGLADLVLVELWPFIRVGLVAANR
jgi:hypothetical protein